MKAMDDDDAVFKALADATRRRLLDHLFEHDGARLADLEALADMTRFGVMKHLRVLEDAGLVVDPPGWGARSCTTSTSCRSASSTTDGSTSTGSDRPRCLADLKRELENDHDHDADLPRVHPRDRRADLGGHHPARAHVAVLLRGAIEITPEASHLARTRRRDLRHRRRARVRPATTARARVEIRATTRSSPTSPRVASRGRSSRAGRRPCLLTLTHDRLEASPRTAADVSGPGWMYVLSSMKTLLETGEGLPRAS